MSNVRVLIIEDELLIAEQLRESLAEQDYDVLDLVDNAQDAKRALSVYQLDIVLIDIMLHGDEDGISVANYINQNHQLPIIFISSLIDSSTIDRAKHCKPAAYLVKPYNTSELYIALDMALFNFENRTIANHTPAIQANNNSHYLVNEHIFIKDKYRFERVNLEDILWLKAESSYVSIATRNKNYLLTTETLKSFMDKLNSKTLRRVHRSFAVNIDKVEALEGNRLFLGEMEIPIGKSYQSAIQSYLRFL